MEAVLLFVGIMQHGIKSHVVEGPARIIQLKHEDIGCGDIIINIEARNFPGNILFLPHAPQHKTQNRLPPSYEGQQVCPFPVDGYGWRFPILVNGWGKKRRHWMGTEDGKIARRRVVGFLVLCVIFLRPFFTNKTRLFRNPKGFFLGWRQN